MQAVSSLQSRPAAVLCLVDQIRGCHTISPQCTSPRQSSWQNGRHCKHSRHIHCTALLTALSDLVPRVCLEETCRAASEAAFLAAVCFPLLMGVAVLTWSYIRNGLQSKVQFEDLETGVVFAAPDGAQPERDAKGQPTFRPISYTPWPVSTDYIGERVRISVGPVNAREPRTYAFSPSLPYPSGIVVVTLPRPLGVVFEYDPINKRTVVLDTLPGSAADQRRNLASMDTQQGGKALLPGDVLRAVTATNFVYSTRAIFGAIPPERHIVLYGADKQRWASVKDALRKGIVKDGLVTFVVERRSIKQPS